jgi:hypothetical protein
MFVVARMLSYCEGCDGANVNNHSILARESIPKRKPRQEGKEGKMRGN